MHAATLGILAVTLTAGNCLAQRDWYVSSGGAGKAGTIDKPVSDLGNIVSKLEPGDRVFISGGVYLGRAANGSDVITVPVEITGGWDPSFQSRDPWGEHATILSGENTSKNWARTARLAFDLSKYRSFEPHRVLVDGVIVDNAQRNRYNDAQTAIIRTANPSQGLNPTPESGGIAVRGTKETDVVIQNCIVLNTAPTDGAIAVTGSENSDVLIENCISINNTGNAFSLTSAWRPRDGRNLPHFTLKNCTGLFSQKFDPIATYGGAAVKLENDTVVAIDASVFGFSDRYTIDNASQSRDVSISNTLFGPTLGSAYVEFSTELAFDEAFDLSEWIQSFDDNEQATPEFAVPTDWLGAYASRAVLDRAAAEAAVSAEDTWANQVRSILGGNLRGTDLPAAPDSWLPRLDRDAVLETARSLSGPRGATRPNF